MCMESRDEFAHRVFQPLWRDDGHARPPGHQVMRDLPKSAGAEAHRQRSIRLVAKLWVGWNRKARASGAAEGAKRSTISSGSSWNTPNECSA